MNMKMESAAIARMIDQTVLKPDACAEDIHRMCEEALRYNFAAAVAAMWHVPLMVRMLRGSPVKVCTIVGFPLGATMPRMKVLEAEEALKLGAQELDMVVNPGALRDGLDDVMEAEIRGVTRRAHGSGAICKVILEAAALTYEEKIRACLIAQRAGADFVKTSTGVYLHGARVEDVRLMRGTVGTTMGVKASGGIRSLADFAAMVDAGASRIGTSSGVAICEEASNSSGH